MGTITLFVFWMAIGMALCYDYNSCADNRKLGSVLEVYPPATEVPRPGAPVDAFIKITTPFKARGNWKLRESVTGKGRYGYETLMSLNIYTVPDSGNGKARATTEYVGSNTYLFRLHLDEYYPSKYVQFGLALEHPCNTIDVWGSFSDWLKVTGQDLPTALRVPKSSVDMSVATERSMKIGIKGTPDMLIKNGYVYFSSQRKNDKLYQKMSIGSRDPMWIEWKNENGGRAPRAGKRVEGVVVMTKRPDKLGDIQAMTIIAQCMVSYSTGGNLNLQALTQILLKHSARGMAIGVMGFQYHHKILTSYKKHEFYDSDGTRVLPIFQDRALLFPANFGCWTEDDNTTPYIAAAKVSGNEYGFEDEVVLEPLTVEASHGIAFNTYEVPKMAVGEETNIVCSAAVGSAVKSTFFRIAALVPVTTSTKNETSVVLNEDTFEKGYQFTCRADGVPRASVKFYKRGKYSMDYPPVAREFLKEGNKYEQLQESDRIKQVTGQGQASLIISPGPLPFTGYSDGDAFRLVCVGYNNFTADAVYVDFIAPH